MQITPYLLKEAFLAKTHNFKHLTRHTNAVGIYHCSLLCSHSQISVRTEGRTEGRKDGQTKYSNPPAHAPRVLTYTVWHGVAPRPSSTTDDTRVTGDESFKPFNARRFVSAKLPQQRTQPTRL